MPRSGPRLGVLSLLVPLSLLWLASPAFSEAPAPSVHWGALVYPDKDRTLETGATFNRFTEFNHNRERYDSTMRETVGLNFATLTWTERMEAWAANVTIGAGPTGNEPTASFQNDFIHNVFLNQPPVPVGTSREAVDFMATASLTRWATILGVESGFVGVGFSSGSLYHEAFARLGVRRLPIPGLPFVRASLVGRYGQLASGSGFRQVAGQSYLAQASVSIGNYKGDALPEWELEFGLSIDSGLFVTPQGNSIEEIFATLALRFPYGHLEFWNDAIAGKDYGPTYGATIMVDLLRLFQRLNASL